MRKLLLTGLLAGVLAAPSAQAYTVAFDPSSNSAVVGGTLSYDVRVSGLGAEVLSAFDITVSFNTAILGLSSVTYFSNLNFGNALDSFQLSTGTGPVQITEASFLDDATLAATQPDDFLLFKLEFNALSVGTTDLKFDNVSLSGHSELDIFGDLVAVNLQVDEPANGSATVRAAGPGNPIPEPAMPALFGAAFLAMFLNSRRNKG